MTYSSKSSEELLCPITDQIGAATWTDGTTTIATTLANYLGPDTDILIPDPGPKHRNFNYTISTTSFSLFIQDVEAEDGGAYRCTTIGVGGSTHEHTVVVEGKMLTYFNISHIISAVYKVNSEKIASQIVNCLNKCTHSNQYIQYRIVTYLVSACWDKILIKGQLNLGLIFTSVAELSYYIFPH